MPPKKPRRIFRRLLWAFAVAIVAGVVACQFVVGSAGSGRIFTDPKAAPETRVGLLLGTAKFLTGGGSNTYYANRIDAAVTLFTSGKISRILVSGDNAERNYNEPVTIRADLIARGIPADRIVLDYAGLRTLDSVVRAHEVFGLDEAIVISQRFQIERAIFLGDRRGIKLSGFVAADPPAVSTIRVRLREIAARVVAVSDALFARAPKFLGPKIPIDGP